MYKRTVAQAHVEGFTLDCFISAKVDVEPSIFALATAAAETVVSAHGGTVGVEPIASEWARHAELKNIAAAGRRVDGTTPALALETIGKLCASRAKSETERLSLIQRLAAWTPESADNLELLIAQAELADLPITFERSWQLATNHFPTMPKTYEAQQELGKRIWNFALDASLATAQPVASNLMDDLYALRNEYVRQCNGKEDVELLSRIDAAIAKLDVLSIPYAPLEPVIEVYSEVKGNVTFGQSEKIVRVVRQAEPCSYVAVIEGKRA